MIEQIQDSGEKEAIAREILSVLTEWFEIPETREAYIRNSREYLFLAAKADGKPVGFLCLKETGRDTAELCVMGVLKPYHRQGIGRALVNAAKEAAARKGYSFLQVKTVKKGVYPEYDATNAFYASCGFKEFEVFPTFWDEANPCQVYVLSLESLLTQKPTSCFR